MLRCSFAESACEKALFVNPALPVMSALPEIPVVDVRGGGPVALARVQRERMDELRAACLCEAEPMARTSVLAVTSSARSIE